MQRGQALIVILLVLAIALTVGLAVVSRSVTDIGTSTTQEESSRALSAAEAGIEAALAAPLNLNYSSPGVIATPVSGNSISIPEALAAGESATIFLTGHDESTGELVENSNPYTGDTLDLCWESPTGVDIGLEATLFYNDSGYKVKRFAYGNNFLATDTTLSSCPVDHSYDKHAQISDLDNYIGKILLRIKLLSNGDTPLYVAVSGSSQFPVQGKNITSEATDGSTTRKIEVFQRYPDLAPMLDSAVYSGTGLSK